MTVDLSDARAQIEDAARSIVADALDTVVELAKADCPVSSGSPDPFGAPDHTHMVDTITVTETVDETPVFGGTVTVAAPYAVYTDDAEGAGSYAIVPVEKTVLRFWWENGYNGPGVYYLRHVNHPPVTGTKWFASHNDDRWDTALSRANG